MTVHMARLYYDTDTAETFDSWLETWITNMSPWEENGHTNQIPTLRETIDGHEYYTGDLRFEWSEDRAIILDNLDQYLASYSTWYRIGYHECTHDGNDGACSWDIQPRESGDIPDYIPRMEP